MISDIKQELEEAGGPLKLSVFSCHDSSVGAILGTFKVFDGAWPPFASYIALETHVEKAKQEEVVERYVRFVYNGDAKVLPDCNG